MPYKPILSGSSTVEITAEEYFELACRSERIDAVERLISSIEYITVNDILALLDIKVKGDENVSE